jgi:pyrimidine-nucleoside phosphorylase
MIPQWVIERKRDGLTLPADEIREFINGYASGEIPDYQMSALAMAIYFRGMSFAEVTALTESMMRSGEVLDTSSIAAPKIDKHSTGGIGDKVSLVLAPLVACCDVAVPMISGRGLGITGGTLDKLQSIPGYRTDLSTAEFLSVLQTCGCSIIGQTAQLAPADRKLYALRDVTGTVPSIPLIAASIMSKKLAEGADGLVLDVKCGKGAFMKTLPEARSLAATMVEIGRGMGKRVAALVTDMNQPLGCTAGNSLEVIETLDTLKGKGPPDVTHVTLALGGHMLRLAGKVATAEEGSAILLGKLRSGAALKKFGQMVALHGGDVSALDDVDRLPRARLQKPYRSTRSAVLADVDAEAIGMACVLLGAGRRVTTDAVDHAVGVSGLVKIGTRVEQGQPLLTLHANDERRMSEALRLLENAFSFSPESASPPPLILETLP